MDLETSKRILRAKSEPKEKTSPEISLIAVENEQKEIILRCFVTAIFFFKGVALAGIDILVVSLQAYHVVKRYDFVSILS